MTQESCKKDVKKKLGWEGSERKRNVEEVKGKEVGKRLFSAGLRFGIDFVFFFLEFLRWWYFNN